MLRILAAVVLLFLVSGEPAQAADWDGRWIGRSDADGKCPALTWVVLVDGGSVSGVIIASTAVGPITIAEIAADGTVRLKNRKVDAAVRFSQDEFEGRFAGGDCGTNRPVHGVRLKGNEVRTADEKLRAELDDATFRFKNGRGIGDALFFFASDGHFSANGTNTTISRSGTWSIEPSGFLCEEAAKIRSCWWVLTDESGTSLNPAGGGTPIHGRLEKGSQAH